MSALDFWQKDASFHPWILKRIASAAHLSKNQGFLHDLRFKVQYQQNQNEFSFIYFMMYFKEPFSDFLHSIERIILFYFMPRIKG